MTGDLPAGVVGRRDDGPAHLRARPRAAPPVTLPPAAQARASFPPVTQPAGARVSPRLVSPLDGLGDDYLFSAHMFQHVLLGDVAPLLILLSLSRVIMRPATRRLTAIERQLGPLASPAACIVVWLAIMYVWHIPALYDAATEHPLIHLLEHLNPEHGKAVLREALRVARRQVVVAVPFEPEPNAAFGHVRTFDLSQLGELGDSTGQQCSFHEHHGGWLVLTAG